MISTIQEVSATERLGSSVAAACPSSTPSGGAWSCLKSTAFMLQIVVFAGSPVTTTRLLFPCSGPPPPPCPGQAADTRVTRVMLLVSCYTCHVTIIILHVSRKLSCSVPVALNQLGVARERRGPRVTIVSTIIVSTLSVCL